jgi:hypothetical protein
VFLSLAIHKLNTRLEMVNQRYGKIQALRHKIVGEQASGKLPIPLVPYSRRRTGCSLRKWLLVKSTVCVSCCESTE